MEEINKYGKYKCPCCGFFTFEMELNNTFQDCPVCDWTDDGIQLDNPDMEGGANSVSLNQAKANFKRYGVKDLRLREYVRPPREDEM